MASNLADPYSVILHEPANYLRSDPVIWLFGTGGLQQAHRRWVMEALQDELAVRDARWSEAIAVGSLAFAEKVKSELGVKAMYREIAQAGGTYALREPGEAYRANLTVK